MKVKKASPGPGSTGESTEEGGWQIRGPAGGVGVLSVVRCMGHLLAVAGAEIGEAGSYCVPCGLF